jgi:arginine exporter protein ArgO
MIAAFLEWFLWLAAFCYCLWKVFCKAENWRTKVLAVAMIIFFVAFRFVNHTGEIRLETNISSLIGVLSCPL